MQNDEEWCLKCSSCHLPKPHSAYSGNQLRSKTKAKCIQCVSSLRQCSSCKLMKTSHDYSSTQLKKRRDLVKCKACVSYLIAKNREEEKTRIGQVDVFAEPAIKTANNLFCTPSSEDSEEFNIDDELSSVQSSNENSNEYFFTSEMNDPPQDKEKGLDLSYKGNEQTLAYPDSQTSSSDEFDIDDELSSVQSSNEYDEEESNIHPQKMKLLLPSAFSGSQVEGVSCALLPDLKSSKLVTTSDDTDICAPRLLCDRSNQKENTEDIVGRLESMEIRNEHFKCSLCERSKPRGEFSNNQLKKSKQTKCKNCVATFLALKSVEQEQDAPFRKDVSQWRRCCKCGKSKNTRWSFSRAQIRRWGSQAECRSCVSQKIMH